MPLVTTPTTHSSAHLEQTAARRHQHSNPTWSLRNQNATTTQPHYTKPNHCYAANHTMHSSPTTQHFIHSQPLHCSHLSDHWRPTLLYVDPTVCHFLTTTWAHTRRDETSTGCNPSPTVNRHDVSTTSPLATDIGGQRRRHPCACSTTATTRHTRTSTTCHR